MNLATNILSGLKTKVWGKASKLFSDFFPEFDPKSYTPPFDGSHYDTEETTSEWDEGDEVGFAILLTKFANTVHTNARSKGFWDKFQEDGTKIALMHSELSEALEAIRKDFHRPDDKIPHHKQVTAELADCVIRILDFAAARKLPIAEAMLDKHLFNKGREFLHGKKF